MGLGGLALLVVATTAVTVRGDGSLTDTAVAKLDRDLLELEMETGLAQFEETGIPPPSFGQGERGQIECGCESYAYGETVDECDADECGPCGFCQYKRTEVQAPSCGGLFACFGGSSGAPVRIRHYRCEPNFVDCCDECDDDSEGEESEEEHLYCKERDSTPGQDLLKYFLTVNTNDDGECCKNECKAKMSKKVHWAQASVEDQIETVKTLTDANSALHSMGVHHLTRGAGQDPSVVASVETYALTNQERRMKQVGSNHWKRRR